MCKIFYHIAITDSIILQLYRSRRKFRDNFIEIYDLWFILLIWILLNVIIVNIDYAYEIIGTIFQTLQLAKISLYMYMYIILLQSAVL